MKNLAFSYVVIALATWLPIAKAVSPPDHAALNRAPKSTATDSKPALTLSLTTGAVMPGSFLALKDSALAFLAYSDNGENLHVIRDGVDTVTRLELSSLATVLLGLTESYIVSGDGGYFTVRDRSTGRFLRHKMFRDFAPPHWVANDVWLDGDKLTFVSEGSTDNDAILRRISIPTLEVSDRRPAPFAGFFTRWGDAIVGVGYSRVEPFRFPPSVAVFDEEFRMKSIAPNDGCRSLCGAMKDGLAAIGNSLFYDAGDGEVRLYNLGAMKPAGTFEPLGPSKLASLHLIGNRLLIREKNGDDSGGSAILLDVPDTHPVYEHQFTGKHVVISGTRVYEFMGDGTQPSPSTDIEIYSLPAD